LAEDAARWSATMAIPHYINKNESDVRRIKSGWCAMDHDGNRQEFFD
jgi:hypothetical protein